MRIIVKEKEFLHWDAHVEGRPELTASGTRANEAILTLLQSLPSEIGESSIEINIQEKPDLQQARE